MQRISVDIHIVDSTETKHVATLSVGDIHIVAILIYHGKRTVYPHAVFTDSDGNTYNAYLNSNYGVAYPDDQTVRYYVTGFTSVYSNDKDVSLQFTPVSFVDEGTATGIVCLRLHLTGILSSWTAHRSGQLRQTFKLIIPAIEILQRMFSVDRTTTVKAIAYLGEESSAVATLEVKVPEMMSLAEFLDQKPADKVRVNGPLASDTPIVATAFISVAPSK